MTPDNPVAERVATLTATVDQLQAEHDRDRGRVALLCACLLLLGVCVHVQGRQLELVVRRLRTGAIA